MKHLAQISLEFLKIAKPWWMGKKFPNPKTRNMVVFKSLPPEEQRRLNALHKKYNELDDVIERGDIKFDEPKSKTKGKKEDIKSKRKEKAKITFKTHPEFFTKDGKRLNTTHGFYSGVKVEINPKWKSKTDDVYYAIQRHPKSGKKQHYYTENYIKKHKKIKFANNQRFGQLLPSIREKYNTDLNSTNVRSRVYATAIALVDQCAMRVGNKKSEQNDVRGLHNLKVKHMTFKDNNKIEFSYTGKDEIPQKHTIEVSAPVKRNLQELITSKGPEDSIFTFKKGEKQFRISPRLVNRYLRKNLGSNVTIHHFRHYHASKIAKEFLDDINVVKFTKKDAKNSVKRASNVVSEFLGNTPKVARRHYIDPAIFQLFFAKAGFKNLKAGDTSMNKTANNSKYFSFAMKSDLNTLTDSEQKFNDDLWAVKLEDLQPFEDIDFADEN